MNPDVSRRWSITRGQDCLSLNTLRSQCPTISPVRRLRGTAHATNKYPPTGTASRIKQPTSTKTPQITDSTLSHRTKILQITYQFIKTIFTPLNHIILLNDTEIIPLLYHQIHQQIISGINQCVFCICNCRKHALIPCLGQCTCN